MGRVAAFADHSSRTGSSSSACQGWLALTAPLIDLPSGNFAPATGRIEDAAVGSLGSLCQAAISGRRAVRAMLPYLRSNGLCEPDLQVLWALRDEATIGVDQTTLARRLAYSAAQVS